MLLDIYIYMYVYVYVFHCDLAGIKRFLSANLVWFQSSELIYPDGGFLELGYPKMDGL